MKSKKQYTLKELADIVGAELRGDGNCLITGIASLHKAVAGQISFLEGHAHRQYLPTTKASVIVLKPEDYAKYGEVAQTKNFLLNDNPYLCYAKLSALFDFSPQVNSGIHKTVVVGTGCNIDPSSAIDAHCVIGNGVRIGKNVQIGPGSAIGDGVSIGEGCRLYAHVTLYHAVCIGMRCILHSGVVIGADGFGMAHDAKGVWYKIHQLGSVVLGNDIEVGANTTIDRGALEDTVIEDGVKLDNQIQVGHNVRIGAHTVIAGCTGIAGSTRIGKHCMIGGGVGISGHIEIADGTIITARSAVGKTIEKAGIYASGIPAVPHKQWWRVLKRLMQLDEIVRKLKIEIKE